MFSLPLLDSNLISNAQGNGEFSTLTVGNSTNNTTTVLNVDGNTTLGSSSSNTTTVNGNLAITNSLTVAGLSPILLNDQSSTPLLTLGSTKNFYISPAGTTPSSTNNVATSSNVGSIGFYVATNLIYWSSFFSFTSYATATLTGQYTATIPVTSYSGPAIPIDGAIFLGQTTLAPSTPTFTYGNLQFYLTGYGLPIPNITLLLNITNFPVSTTITASASNLTYN